MQRKYQEYYTWDSCPIPVEPEFNPFAQLVAFYQRGVLAHIHVNNNCATNHQYINANTESGKHPLEAIVGFSLQYFLWCHLKVIVDYHYKDIGPEDLDCCVDSTSDREVDNLVMENII